MTEGLGGGADFFGRIPLFREFARLMATASGPVNWELARQVAVATAAGAEDLGMMPQLPRPAAAPDPGEARSWDDRLRLAELWVDPVTSLPGPGVALVARPVNRPDWAEAVLGGFAPLVEPGARRVAEALGTGAGMGPPGVGDMVGRVGGLVAGLQVGTLVGQLARSVLGQYELAMPAPDPAKVLLVPENVADLRAVAPTCPATSCGSGWPATRWPASACSPGCPGCPSSCAGWWTTSPSRPSPTPPG